MAYHDVSAAAVAANVHKSLDVQLHKLAEIALDDVLADLCANRREFLLCQPKRPLVLNALRGLTRAGEDWMEKRPGLK